MTRKGLMLILSSPSGAGKTTISRHLLHQEAELRMSVSATTRPPRPGETHGQDYYFFAQEEFENSIKSGAFFEYAQVFGHFYGTPRQPVENMLSQGMDVLFDIDWQGTQQIRQKSPDDVVTVFILPPSSALLEQRLRGRKQDDEEVIKQRMRGAEQEMSHWSEYDYIIVNENVAQSVHAVSSILHAERLRRHRQIGLPQFVQNMMSELE